MDFEHNPQNALRAALRFLSSPRGEDMPDGGKVYREGCCCTEKGGTVTWLREERQLLSKSANVSPIPGMKAEGEDQLHKAALDSDTCAVVHLHT